MLLYLVVFRAHRRKNDNSSGSSLSRWGLCVASKLLETPRALTLDPDWHCTFSKSAAATNPRRLWDKCVSESPWGRQRTFTEKGVPSTQRQTTLRVCTLDPGDSHFSGLRYILSSSKSSRECLRKFHCEKAEVCIAWGSDEFARTFELEERYLNSSPKVHYIILFLWMLKISHRLKKFLPK